MRIKFVLFIIAVMISLQATAAYGMGIGVSPGNMSFKLDPGTSAEQPIYVINTGNETANYDVFVNESTYQNWFTFSPSSFTLKAGEQKEVKVMLKVPASAETDIKCKIKIPCTVPGKIIGTGIIIPVHIEISTLEGDSAEVVSSGGSSSGGKGGSSDPFTKIKVKEILQQFLENNSDARFIFTQNITHIGEKLKDYAENLEVIEANNLGNSTRLFEGATNNLSNVTKSLDNSTKDLDDVVKSLREKDPSALAKIEGYEAKLQALPGFDALLEGLCLVISGLLMKRQLSK